MGFRCPGSGQQEPAFSRVVLVGEGCCSCVRARDAPRAYFLCALLSSTQFLVVFELLGSISSVVLLHLPWVGSKLWDSPPPSLSVQHHALSWQKGSSFEHKASSVCPCETSYPCYFLLLQFANFIIMQWKENFPFHHLPCMQCS